MRRGKTLQLRFQFLDAGEDAPFKRPPFQLREPRLHCVKPGSAGGREMQLKARMLGQPLGNRRGLMTAAVVQNQVQIQLLVSLPVNRAQELQKLLRPMALRNAREYLAVSDRLTFSLTPN